MIELLIVVVIVGVLAAVAVPIYRNQGEKAKKAEAVAALGAIRRAQAAYKNEHGTFLGVAQGDMSNAPHHSPPGLGLDFSSNAYFGTACFSVLLNRDGKPFVAIADGTVAANNAPRASEVRQLVVSMDHTGQITFGFSIRVIDVPIEIIGVPIEIK